MADIRQTTTAIDDFNRANETPIASPWVRRFAASAMGRLQTSRYMPAASGTSLDCHTGVGPYDGDDQEVWATPWSITDGSEFWYLGLLKDLNGASIVDGYIARELDGVGATHSWSIMKYANQGLTVIAGPLDHSPVLDGTGASAYRALFRREGNDLVIYQSQDSGANWTEKLRVTDTSFMTGLYPGVGIGSSDGTGPGWDNFGGGPAPPVPPVTFVPRIYRRRR